MGKKSIINQLVILSVFIPSLYATMTPDSVLIVPKAATPPVIDGKLDGIWHSVTNTFMEKHLSYMPEPDNWFDLWGSFRVLWDDENMYLFVHVMDDIIRTDGPNPWDVDCVELCFDGNNSKTFEDYDGEDDVLMRFAYNFSSTDSILIGTNSKGDWFDPSNIIFKKLDTDYGWDLEISIPIDDLLIYAEPDYKFGFEINISDNDSGQRDHGWRWWTGDNDAWQYANLLGTAMLSDYAADSVMQILYTPVSPAIDGQMDDIWADIPEISHNQYVTHGSGDIFDFDIYTALDDWYDCAFQYRVMWDQTYIYFFTECFDNILLTPDMATHQNDGFEFFFDGDNSKRTLEQAYDDNDMQIRFEWEDSEPADLDGNNNPDNLTGIQFSQAETETGWIMEAAFPFSMLDIINPSEGDVLGFELQYNENDTGQRDAVARWWSDDNSSFENAGLFGTVKLVGGTDDIPLVNESRSHTADLGANYPNPFNPETTIPYFLSGDTDVHFRIYDVMGHTVFRQDQDQKSGYYQILWDGCDSFGHRLPGGIYFYRLETKTFREVKKMIMVK